MKLRYYLRGLGIGIVVTALIMGLSDKDARPLTDAEIKAKAAALGMVESESLKLTDVVSSPEPIQKPAESTTETTPKEPSGTEEEETAVPETTPTPAVTVNPETPQEVSQAEQETVNITIQSGSGSDTVCRQLEKAGLIESASAFDQYLIENGYSKRICVGTYEIQKGTTEEEIAKIITKTR